MQKNATAHGGKTNTNGGVGKKQVEELSSGLPRQAGNACYRLGSAGG